MGGLDPCIHTHTYTHTQLYFKKQLISDLRKIDSIQPVCAGYMLRTIPVRSFFKVMKELSCLKEQMLGT